MLLSFSFRVGVFSSLHIITLVWITFHIQNGLLASITTISTSKMIALVALEVCSLKLFVPSCHFVIGSMRVKPQDSLTTIDCHCRIHTLHIDPGVDRHHL